MRTDFLPGRIYPQRCLSTLLSPSSPLSLSPSSSTARLIARPAPPPLCLQPSPWFFKLGLRGLILRFSAFLFHRSPHLSACTTAAALLWMIVTACRELEFLDVGGCWDVKLDEEWLAKRQLEKGLKVLGPEIVAGMVPPKEMNFRCIHCGFPVETLFIQYSPGNIRLMKCENCRSVADEYIECEIMILLIDLVLHKSKAYQHLLNNFPKLNGVYLEGLLWKSALSFMLLDAYRQFVLYRSNKEWVPTQCSSFPWLFGKLLLSSFFGILAFICILYPACNYLQKSPRKAIRFNQVLLATLVSSYFKIVLIAMMVWQFPVTAIFIIDIFTLSSNAVALKVLMQITMAESVAACIIAHSAKLLVNYIALLAI